MEAFLARKKRRLTPEPEPVHDNNDDEPTEVKLAMLSSLHPALEQETLLDVLLAHDGSVSAASASLTSTTSPAKKQRPSGAMCAQTSLKHFAVASPNSSVVAARSPKKARLMSKKGSTLHLYSPEDIAEHTPCTIIHNFLPADLADALLLELLEESKTFEKITFKLFDTVVSSPHTSGFFVGTAAEQDSQRHEYLYNGARLTDVRTLTPMLDAVKARVRDAVNEEIQTRIRTRYPGGKKLKHQSPRPWSPNAAFVNCYAGPQQSVGWHSDQLTYLGPRAVIGSLSLGVAREFRVRRVVCPKDDGDAGADADLGGQIAIHLPHNSLLIMHAEMQEEWKHSVAPAQVIDPHPLAGSKRINITYRDYRPEFHPRFTPRCKCGVPGVLRVVQKKRENWGRYFWMCHASNVPGKEGCNFFLWAEFDEDGSPVWERMKSAVRSGNGNDG
ncbi:GRF zinc finger domain-containing protein [Coniochaeta ligniaria NRRL 30616]|uniref:GRF zinc finger domain-containing protein n=1 Tax=Coniochaeta ligniaria NRRL 30616 TaxID=1408157 RepID=A0A1J7IXU5_9PEZI|nr:GRF zinc finger domain-containing protein [Coniochaeta ligniaria NRRL 30616]